MAFWQYLSAILDQDVAWAAVKSCMPCTSFELNVDYKGSKSTTESGSVSTYSVALLRVTSQHLLPLAKTSYILQCLLVIEFRRSKWRTIMQPWPPTDKSYSAYLFLFCKNVIKCYLKGNCSSEIQQSCTTSSEYRVSRVSKLVLVNGLTRHSQYNTEHEVFKRLWSILKLKYFKKFYFRRLTN